MERRIRLILVVAFLFIGACQSAPKAPSIELNCKPQYVYTCEINECTKEKTSSVYLEFKNGIAEVGMHSVVGKDSAPKFFSRQSRKYFILHAQAKSVGGEKLEIHSLGEILKDHSFKALIDGTHYVGQCKSL